MSKKEEFRKRFIITFAGGVADIDSVWTWIEQEIKQAEEKGYNKGFGVGYERAILRYGTINQT